MFGSIPINLPPLITLRYNSVCVSCVESIFLMLSLSMLFLPSLWDLGSCPRLRCLDLSPDWNSLVLWRFCSSSRISFSWASASGSNVSSVSLSANSSSSVLNDPSALKPLIEMSSYWKYGSNIVMLVSYKRHIYVQNLKYTLIPFRIVQ